jgi:hypothetical protein
MSSFENDIIVHRFVWIEVKRKRTRFRRVLNSSNNRFFLITISHFLNMALTVDHLELIKPSK